MSQPDCAEGEPRGWRDVEQFVGWFPGVARAQVDAVLKHAARSAYPVTEGG